MQKIMIIFLTYIILLVGCKADSTAKTNQGKIIWKHGIAILKGKAQYIDVDKLDSPTIVVAQKTIGEVIEKSQTIIKAGKLLWRKDYIRVYDTNVNSPYRKIVKSKKNYDFKISKNIMYIRKDNGNWEKLSIKIIDEKPPQRKGKFSVPIYMIIHLSCKYFEGYYELIGTTG